MAINLSIDPKLIRRALAVSGERTKKATVTKAPKEFIARRERQRMVERNRIQWHTVALSGSKWAASTIYVSIYGNMSTLTNR